MNNTASEQLLRSLKAGEPIGAEAGKSS
jgi:hypothetical protein